MASFDNGFIKIYRKMLAWEWYSDTNTVRVFLHCLLKANWKTKTWRGVEIQRGSFITSRQKLSKELGLSEKQIRTSLEHLEETGEVAKSTTSRYSVITVLKYDEYQQEGQVNGQQNGQQKGRKKDQERATTEEKNKNTRRKEKIKKPPHRGWVLAEVWNAQWWYDHHPDDGWVVEEIDGVKWGHKVKT